MNKTEIKRLARHMASDAIRGVLENDGIEAWLEITSFRLNEEEKEKLAEAMQEIIERLERP